LGNLFDRKSVPLKNRELKLNHLSGRQLDPAAALNSTHSDGNVVMNICDSRNRLKRKMGL
jgi:hypothetical protein